MLPLGIMLLAVGALAAGVVPASATFNWDYSCKTTGKRLDIDVNAVFNAGSAGPITVRELSATLMPEGDASGDPGFTSSDVEQFWAADDAFLIGLSRYVGSESEPARLTVKTTCKARKCKGTYAYERGDKKLKGSIACTQSEAG